MVVAARVKAVELCQIGRDPVGLLPIEHGPGFCGPLLSTARRSHDGIEKIGRPEPAQANSTVYGTPRYGGEPTR